MKQYSNGTHLLFCSHNERLGQTRVSAVAAMKVELLRIYRLTTDLLGQPMGSSHSIGGFVDFDRVEGTRKPLVVFVPASAGSAVSLASPAPSAPSSLTTAQPPVLYSIFSQRLPAALPPSLPAAAPSTLPTVEPSAAASSADAAVQPCVAAESAAVRAAVALSVEQQQAEFEQLCTLLDSMRAGSSDAPTQAAWMKVLVHAQPLDAAAIEHPMAALATTNVVCPVSDRMLRPCPLDMLFLELTRFHVDLVANPTLAALMRAHGYASPPCAVCGGETKYLGDSMTIEKEKKKATVTGGLVRTQDSNPHP